MALGYGNNAEKLLRRVTMRLMRDATSYHRLRLEHSDPSIPFAEVMTHLAISSLAGVWRELRKRSADRTALFTAALDSPEPGDGRAGVPFLQSHISTTSAAWTLIAGTRLLLPEGPVYPSSGWTREQGHHGEGLPSGMRDRIIRKIRAGRLGYALKLINRAEARTAPSPPVDPATTLRALNPQNRPHILHGNDDNDASFRIRPENVDEDNLRQVLGAVEGAALAQQTRAALTEWMSNENASEDPVLKLEDLSQVIKGLDRDSAPGHTGWTFSVIRRLFEWDTDATQELFSFFSTLISPQSAMEDKAVYESYTTSRSVLIPKGHGGGWRPLGLSCALVRVLHKTVSAAVARRVGAQLAPLQLSVGTKAGCETLAAMLSAAIKDSPAAVNAENSTGLLSVDASNAFSEIHRPWILKGIADRCPSLIPVFLLWYGRGSTLRLGSGDTVTQHTGVRQGDPLGMLYFALGAQDALIQMNERLQERASAHPAPPPSPASSPAPSLAPSAAPSLHAPAPLSPPANHTFVAAYADDVNLVGPLPVIQAFAADVTAILAECGLRVNAAKTKILALGREGHGEAHGIEILTGHTVAGVPLGTDAYIRSAVQGKVVKMTADIDRLRLLKDCQSEHALLRYCIVARPGYLQRTVLPTLASTALRSFDQRIDEELGRQCELSTPLPLEARVLRGIPISLGGAGIPRLSGPGHVRAALTGRLAVQLTLANFQGHAPAILQAIKASPLPVLDQEEWRSSVSGLCEPPQSATVPAIFTPNQPTLEIAADGLSTEAIKETHTARMRFLAARVWGHLYAADNGAKRPWAAWLLSNASVGTAPWLAWRGNFSRELQALPHGLMHHLLRLRLAIPMTDFDPDVLNTAQCGCTAAATLSTEPLHMLQCLSNSAIKKERHDNVARAIVAGLRAASARDRSGVTFFDGQGSCNVPFPSSSLFADFMSEARGRTTYYDVTIVNPATQRMVRVLHTAEQRDSAVADAVRRKRDKYRAAIAAVTSDADTQTALLAQVHFLVFETSGRAGADTQQLLDTLLRQKTRECRACYQAISMQIAHANARTAASTLTSLRGHLHSSIGQPLH